MIEVERFRSILPVLWGMIWVICAVLGWWAFQPPAVVPATADSDRFSAARAMVHVQTLTQSPRMVGMPGHAAAIDHITQTLQQLGWEVSTTTGWAHHSYWGAQVTNISATLPGSSSEPAVLLVSHHDSVPTSPGAGDAAAGVGAILEVARILAQSPPQHPVQLLLTDGEELGLLGAHWFATHGGLDGIGMVVNVEARGGGGASMLFETHPNNAGVVDVFATSPVPVGTSLAGEVYRRMPNDTDFTVFQSAGMPGVNFAFIDRFHHYHSALDTAEGLDLRSVQHHGENLLALAQGLDASATEDTHGYIYFPLPGRKLAHYPMAWAMPLVVLAGGVLGVAAWRRPRRLSAVMGGMLWAALVIIGASLTGLLVGLGISYGLEELSEIRYPLPYREEVWVLGAVLLISGVAVWVGALAHRWAERHGVAMVWWMLSLLAAITAPGGSYLFVWPVLAMAAGAMQGSLVGLGAMVGWFLMAPLLSVLFLALGMAAAVPVGLLIGLLVTMSTPEWPVQHQRRLGAACVGVALCVLCLAWMQSGIDDQHPRHEGRILLEEDGHVRHLVWSPRRLGEIAIDHPLVRSPVSEITAPHHAPHGMVTRWEDVPSDSGRRVRLHVQTDRPASMLRIAADDDRLLAVRVGAEPWPVSSAGIMVFADLMAGVDVEMDVLESRPLSVQVQTTAFELPVGIEHSPQRISTPWGMGTPDMAVVVEHMEL